MGKKGSVFALIFLVIVLATFCLAEESVFERKISNKFLLNTRPLSPEDPEPVSVYFIIVANMAIVIFDLVVFLSIYSFIERFEEKSAKILGLSIGYLVFVIPVFLFAPVAFVFMTFFYMVGIMVPTLVKRKYIPVRHAIGFGGGFLNEEIRGFGGGIKMKENIYYD